YRRRDAARAGQGQKSPMTSLSCLSITPPKVAYLTETWAQQPGWPCARRSTWSQGTCAPSSRPVMNAAFIGHTTSRCDTDSSAKMQLRIVHSPDASTRGSYPSCVSLVWTASSRAALLLACRRISSPRLVPTAVATSRSDPAPSASDSPEDREVAIIDAASAY